MNKKFSIICVVLALISCSKNEKESINDSLYGTWVLVEKVQSGSDGLSAWLPVNEFQFYTLTLSEEGILTHSKYENNGTFELISSNLLRVHISSNQGNLQGEYKYVLENKNLFLSPVPNTCDEGCSEKFVRI